MVADLIFVSTAILGCIAGCITDLKGRWVPDWINYFLIIFGIGGHAIVSVTEYSIWPLLYSLAGAGVFFAVSAVMFYSGAWGGGDAKLLIGLGALLPISPGVLSSGAPWPFLLTLWINMLMFNAVFGLLGISWLAAKNFSKIKKEVAKNKLLVYGGLSSLAIPALLILFNSMLLTLFLIWIFAVMTFIFLLLARAVEKNCMYKFIPPSKLVEGDWIAEKVIAGDFIYNPARSGIEKKDINKLIELEKSGKLKLVKVKDGFPFVPAFLAGLLTSLFYGDIMFIIINKLI